MYKSRIMIASKNWGDKKCFYCGEYFKVGENIILIVPTYEVKKRYNKLELNVAMHLDEFNRLDETMTDEKLIEHLGNHKTTRKKMVITTEQARHMDAFKRACCEFGIRIEVDALQREHMIKQRKSGTSITLQYNPLTDNLSVHTKVRKRGMFDSIFEAELVAKIYNRMHEILADGKVDNFKASELFNSAIENTHKILGK